MMTHHSVHSSRVISRIMNTKKTDVVLLPPQIVILTLDDKINLNHKAMLMSRGVVNNRLTCNMIQILSNQCILLKIVLMKCHHQATIMMKLEEGISVNTNSNIKMTLHGQGMIMDMNTNKRMAIAITLQDRLPLHNNSIMTKLLIGDSLLSTKTQLIITLRTANEDNTIIRSLRDMNKIADPDLHIEHCNEDSNGHPYHELTLFKMIVHLNTILSMKGWIE